MKLLNHIMIAALVICLPVISVLAAENAICRLPDFYAYEFTNAQISEEIEGDITDQALADFVSDFMTGKTETFRYSSYELDWEKELFNEAESRYMAEARTLLNTWTVVLAGTVAFAAAACVFLIRKGEKNKLRAAFKLSAGWYALLWVMLAPMTLSTDPSKAFGDESLLATMLSKTFLQEWIVAGIAGSAIIMLLLGSLLWRLSRPKRMFW